jgi:hypothetical protein
MAKSVLTPFPLWTQQFLDAAGNLASVWRNYQLSLDLAVRTPTFGTLVSATSDQAAANLGVPVNGLYQNAGVVHVRLK